MRSSSPRSTPAAPDRFCSWCRVTPGSKEDFVPVLDPLRHRGFRAVAVDLPGQYESAGPDDEDAYSVDSLGEVVAALVTNLSAGDADVVLLGHSFGGLVTRAAVIGGAPVVGLISLCSGSGALTYGARVEALAVGAPLLREQGVAAAWSLRAATTDTLVGVESPELTAFRHQRFLATSAASLLGMGTALTTEPDRTSELHSSLAGRPVAVLTGEHDDAWTPASQADMAHRLGVEQVLIPDSAHSPAVENPDYLVDVLAGLMDTWTGR